MLATKAIIIIAALLIGMFAVRGCVETLGTGAVFTIHIEHSGYIEER